MGYFHQIAKFEDSVKFQKGFQESGKQISEKAAIHICIQVNSIHHYVQLLAHHSLLRTTTRCTIQIVNTDFAPEKP